MSIKEIASRVAGKAKDSKPAEARTGPAIKPGPAKKLDLPEVYYEAPKRAFWTSNDRGEWVEYPASHVRLLLLRAGVSCRGDNDAVMTPIEEEFLRIRERQDVQWAGALAGFLPGIYDVCGVRILVTSGPKRISAARGAWPTLKTFLGELLGDQCEHLWGWLKSALRSLYSGRPFRPGQALAIAGPSGCGKSLLQGLITEIFGGRVAKPYRYLSGETPFNGELFAAEHLAIEDEVESSDLRTRRAFGAGLKNMIANEVVSFHQKGRQAMALPPFWRVSITLNEDAENLMVLPPIDDGLRDKITLLRAFCTNLPFSPDNLKERAAFRAKLSAEMPAFVQFLSTWRIPPRMIDKRFGVKAWQNPELLADLESLQPEFRLLELIDTLQIWSVDDDAWEGTQAELRRALEDKDKRGEVARLLSFNTACGVYLGRLKRHFPRRIASKKNASNNVVWTISKR